MGEEFWMERLKRVIPSWSTASKSTFVSRNLHNFFARSIWRPRKKMVLIASTKLCSPQMYPTLQLQIPPLVAFFRLLKGGGICRILKKSSRNENFPQNPTVIRCKTSSKTENFTIVYIFGKHIYRRFPLEILSICIYQMKIEHILLLIFRCRFWLLQFFLLVRLCASKHKAHAFKTLMKVCTVLYV